MVPFRFLGAQHDATRLNLRRRAEKGLRIIGIIVLIECDSVTGIV